MRAVTAGSLKPAVLSRDHPISHLLRTLCISNAGAINDHTRAVLHVKPCCPRQAGRAAPLFLIGTIRVVASLLSTFTGSLVVWRRSERATSRLHMKNKGFGWDSSLLQVP